MRRTTVGKSGKSRRTSKTKPPVKCSLRYADHHWHIRSTLDLGRTQSTKRTERTSTSSRLRPEIREKLRRILWTLSEGAERLSTGSWNLGSLIPLASAQYCQQTLKPVMKTRKKSAPSTDMICGRPSSCRAFRALTVN